TSSVTAAPAPANAAASHGAEPPPPGLTEVHIIGTKYIDYFTDDTGEHSFPGDSAIDAHLSEKDGPTPTHQGMTWEHTTGQNLYDTTSGDLEVGDYAVQPNGAYIANPFPFVSSTSTPAQTSDNPPSSTATTSESTTPPAI